MEKKIPSRTEKLRPVKLYLDDLEQIVSILKVESNEVKIETDEYKYESLEELVGNRKETIYELKLGSGRSVWSPVKLSLDKYFVELFISEDEPRLRGLFEKIKEILVKRERVYRRLVSPIFSLIFSVFSLTIIIVNKFLYPLPLIILPFLYFIIIPSATTISLIIVVWLNMEKGKYSIIVLKHRSDQVSFWKRNKDQVLLLIIGTVIGAVITVLGTIILNVLSK